MIKPEYDSIKADPDEGNSEMEQMVVQLSEDDVGKAVAAAKGWSHSQALPGQGKGTWKTFPYPSFTPTFRVPSLL